MRTGWTGYAWAIGATLAATLAGFAMRGRFDLVNIAMVYLLAVVLVAPRLPPAQPLHRRRPGSGQPPRQYLVDHHQPFLFFLVQYHLIHLGGIFAFLL